MPIDEDQWHNIQLLGGTRSPQGNQMNLLKQYKLKNNKLYHLRGPLAGKPAGHKYPNGQVYIIFEGVKYTAEDLLFLYNEQLNSKHLEHINTSTPQDYQTISGHEIIFTLTTETAPPYVIHGAVRMNSQWHACQWTNKGEAPHPEYNLRKIK